MNKALYKTSFNYAAAGVALQLASAFMVRWTPLGMPVGLAGTALLCVGLGYRARAKGRTALWGVFGLLSLFGLLVLVMLSDREPAMVAAGREPTGA